MLGKNEGRRTRRWTEDEMVGWHHRLNGHEFERTPRDSGQGSLASAVHGVTELDMIEQLNNNQSFIYHFLRLCIGCSLFPNWLLFAVVQSLSRVLLFATPRTAACQASLSFTISQSLLRLMSIE